MQTKRLSLKALGRELAKDLSTLEKRSLQAASRAAELGRLIAYAAAPVAFGEVRDGLVAEDLSDGARIRSSAPYSAAVELGSRPHMPPVEPILAWVRLRGAQGLDAGASPRGAPAFVAGAIAKQGNNVSTPVDAAERVAWAIAIKISREGTDPTHFMGNSVDAVVSLLDAFMKSLLAEPL